jgi:hypothetical protein
VRRISCSADYSFVFWFGSADYYFECLLQDNIVQCCGSGSGIRDWVLFDPWIRDPGWEKVSIRIRDPGSGMNNPDHIFLELRNHFFAFFRELKYLNSLMRIRDPGSGMETVRIRDPGWKKVGSGIRDKHPGSATLISSVDNGHHKVRILDLEYQSFSLVRTGSPPPPLPQMSVAPRIIKNVRKYSFVNIGSTY